MGRLTKKQKAFCDHYLEEGVGSRAAIKAGYKIKNNQCARSVACENLTKIDIRKYLEEHAGGAMTRIEELSRKSKNEVVKLNANKDIMDRAGYKPIEQHDLKSGGKAIKNVNLIGIDLSTKSYEELRRLIAEEDTAQRGLQD